MPVLLMASGPRGQGSQTARIKLSLNILHRRASCPQRRLHAALHRLLELPASDLPRHVVWKEVGEDDGSPGPGGGPPHAARSLSTANPIAHLPLVGNYGLEELERIGLNTRDVVVRGVGPVARTGELPAAAAQPLVAVSGVRKTAPATTSEEILHSFHNDRKLYA